MSLETSTSLDCKCDFPALAGDLIYLDSAATTHKPKCVIDAMSHFYAREYATVHRSVYESAERATARYEGARSAVANFIHAECDEIVFTSGTTESLNLVAHSFGRQFIQEGDEIILSVLEHHSNLIPWQILAKEVGATLKFIPLTETGDLDLEVYASLLSKKTKLVSIAHISNVLGTINPISKMTAMAHSVGAKVCIDGAQAASHEIIDVKALNVDFYAFSGHKMYGPTGIGILYTKSKLLESMPPFLAGGDMIEEVHLTKSTYLPSPQRFEAGTGKIAQVIGLAAAIKYIESIGLEQIVQHETNLLNLALDHIEPIKRPQHQAPILTFVPKKHHPLDLATLLDCKSIAIRTGHLCAQPLLRILGHSSVARISFGLYNTPEDIEHLIHHLSEIQ